MSANAKPPARKGAPRDDAPLPSGDRTNPGGPAPEVLAAARAQGSQRRLGGDEAPLPSPGDATLIYDKNKVRPLGGDAARLIVLAGPRAGSELQISGPETSIGRGEDNTVVVPDISVSRRHVVVLRDGESFVLVDQGSGNGTRVNGRQVARHPLATGDEIALGDTVVQFVGPGGVVVRGARSRSSAPALPKGEGAGGRGAIRASGGAVPGEERPEVTHSRAQGLKRRGPLYTALLVLIACAIGAGLFRRHQRELREAEAAREGEEGRALAQQRFEEAVTLVKEGRWLEARDRLKVAAELDPQDAELARYLERAQAESPRAQAVAEARAALLRRDFVAAREALEGVPDDSALADAAHELSQGLRAGLDQAVGDARAKVEAGDRQGAAQLIAKVLAADPQRSDALAVKAAATEPRTAAPSAQAQRREERVEPAVAAAGPIVDAYLSGDLGAAIDRADLGQDTRAQRLARDLKAFDAAYRDGLAKAQQKRAADAVAALEKAEKLDRVLAQGRDSRLGREVRRALANLHTTLGMAAAAGPDEQLPAAAAHLRAAASFDPQNEQAHAQLGQVIARTRELYLRGYVAKEGETDDARRSFRLVLETLPASDETAQKARRWLDKLDGKGAKEDGL